METLVRIALPLPLDISATLLKAVGTVYPHTSIRTDQEEDLVLSITDEDRRDPQDIADPDSVRTPLEEDVEAFVSDMRDGTLGMSMPEWYSRMTVAALEDVLEDTSAENYLEMTVVSEGKRYAVVVCRSEEQTPHKLRRQAEERAERYAAKLRELGIDPDTL